MGGGATGPRNGHAGQTGLESVPPGSQPVLEGMGEEAEVELCPEIARAYKR